MIQNWLVAAPGMMAPHKRARNTQLKADRHFTAYQETINKLNRLILITSASMGVLLFTHLAVSLTFCVLVTGCLRLNNERAGYVAAV